MEIITGTVDFRLSGEVAVAIGKFDGVHIGHRCLLEEIMNQKKNGRKACVFTFDVEPGFLFGKEEKLLNTREEKRNLFEYMGIDVLIEYPLNAETAKIDPKDFVEQILVDRMNTVFLAAGTDLSFGAGGKGNAKLVKSMAPDLGMEVRIIDKIMVDEREVSSTYVRETVEKGDMILAESLLGEPYFVTGKVIHGRKLGRDLGMPTLNIVPDAGKLLPPCGVYYAGVRMNNRYYQAISNIGYKPTVEMDEPVLGVETYLYDFEGNAYGEEIMVFLYAYKRPEEKFEDIEALKEQLKEDMLAGRMYER